MSGVVNFILFSLTHFTDQETESQRLHNLPKVTRGSVAALEFEARPKIVTLLSFTDTVSFVSL